MGINLTKKYRLLKKDKEILVSYLHGEIGRAEAAAAFGVAPQNFPGIVAAVIRYLVQEGEIDITSALKNY
jgi:hypothetical protein